LNVTISDDEAKKYYEDHPSQFEEPEKIHASHILFATRDMTTGTALSDEQKTAKRKQAEAALKRIRAGEDFAKIATEFSDDPASKEKGGELPPLARGQMVPEFEAAAMSLNTNQVSDLVTTAYGFHIIKLLEKLPARKLAYDKVDDELKEALKQQAMLKKLPEYTTKLRKDANVEILDEKLILKEEPEPPAEPAALDKPAKAVEKKK
jgi:parvulin-like peptidyl-prolyl isomerase